MKTLLLLCCLLPYGLLNAQKTVDKPPFISATTKTIEVSAIHRSDTATVLDIDAKFAPKQWIRIAPGTCLVGDDGQSYPIRRGIGIELGENFFMPETGQTTFSLLFPVLPASVKSFDFVEGKEPGDFCIFGISLTGKLPKLQLPAALKKQKLDYSIPLPKVEIKNGTAIVSGHLLEYRENFRLPFEVARMDLLSGTMKRDEVKVNSDGTFRAEVPLYSPAIVYLRVGLSQLELLLVPGGELRMTVNLRELARAGSRVLKDTKAEGQQFYFEGTMAALNTEMNAGKKPQLCEVDNKDIYNMEYDAYKAYSMQKYEEADAAIRNDKKLSETYRSLLVLINKGQLHKYLNNASNILRSSFVQFSGLSRKEASETFNLKHPTVEYYSYWAELGFINSPEALYYFDYPSMVKYMPFIAMRPEDMPYKNIFEYLLASDKVSAEDKAAISAYKQWTNAGDKTVIDAIKKMQNKYDAMFQEYGALCSDYALNKIVEENVGADKGLFFDLRKSIKCAKKLDDFTPLSEGDFDDLRSIENPLYLDRLTTLNNELLQQIEENKKKTGFTVHTLGDVKDDELLDAIVAPFKGKVLLVDFWATWCGPCKMGMKLMEPMKNELKDKEIVYIYVAGENSPRATWENMIPTIHGEHYRLSNAQWTAICDKFSIRGVPTYFILNPEGEKIYSTVGFPGAAVIKTELLKALSAADKK